MSGSDEQRRRKGLFEAIFPKEYDFEGMLVMQAEMTARGVRGLLEWMEGSPQVAPTDLDKRERELDEYRHGMEDKLSQAFSTPFDRQEIYGLSRQMDYILNYSVETAREMFAFQVPPDSHTRAMAEDLLKGTEAVVEGVRILASEKDDFEGVVRRARGFMHEIEAEYMAAMGSLFKETDVVMMMKRGEIYRHLRDAGRALRTTVDVLHRMKVDIV